MITYASINKNALVIAGAGNTGDESVFNPASIKYVLSVGGTDTGDIKTYNSTYGTGLDLCAPGIGTYTTNVNDTYTVLLPPVPYSDSFIIVG